MAGAGPDVLVEVHDLLLEGELCPRDLHPAGEDSLERQGVGGDGGVHHHVVHQAPSDCCGGDGGLCWSASNDVMIRKGNSPLPVSPPALLRVDVEAEAGLGVDLLD